MAASIQKSTAKVGLLPLMNLVRLKGFPILEQLFLEEKLLRTSPDNWCLVNDGTNQPSIVMGVSGKPRELLEVGSVLRDQIPVIRRYTGGGTVVVDKGTIFVTFICNKHDVPEVQPYPRPIMSWTGALYGQVFRGFGDFQLRENDYVFGDRKFGGNAQSITKNRWIHHTSLLWDYDVENMAYLKQPTRAPDYRSGRHHLEFVCRLNEYMSRAALIEKTLKALSSHFTTKPINLDDIGCGNEFLCSTKLLTVQELKDAAASLHEEIAYNS